MDFKRILCALFLILLFTPCSFAKKNKDKTEQTVNSVKKENKKDKKSKKKNEAAQSQAGQEQAGQEQGSDQSQDEGQDEEEGAPEQNWQVLEWEDENSRLALRYDIMIQQRDRRGNYFDLVTLKTTDNTTQVKIEPPLPPGVYRYRIVSYNLFGVAKAQSDWEDFSIFKAYKPRVSDTTVNVNLSSNIYLDYKNDGIITFGGRNLFLPPEAPDDISFSNYVLRSSNGKSIKPLEILEHSDNDRKIQFKFDMNDLDVGKYSLAVTDASGLTNDPENGNLLTVRFKKWMDFNISVGYVCPIVLFDDTIQTYFETNIFPLGGTGRMTWFPFKRRWGSLGVGLSASYTWMKFEKTEYKLESNLGAAHLYFAYSKSLFNKRFNLEAHAGAGVTALLGYRFTFEHDIKSDPQSSLNISAMAGVAAQVFVFKRLYVEVAADFIAFIIPDDMIFGAVFPSASVGWQF